jgi:anhydro-N-acetylmuramic acid kinase
MTESGGIFVGLMSGTSLDGISAAVVRFADAGLRTEHELIGFSSVPYTDSQRERLLGAMSRGSAEEYCALSFELGEWLASAAITSVQQAGITLRDVRAIASHGQTLWHSPRRATWHIGEASVIDERKGVDVV